jgi:hypothetical protein
MSAAKAEGGEGKRGSWWAFEPTDDIGPSVIDAAGWLDKPAGCHGFVRMDGDRLAFEDGTPVKFWGTNHGNVGCAPPKEEADFRAARYAKYGLNCIRMHKFTWHGGSEGIGSTEDSTQLDPAGLDRLDYYFAKLRERGIYTGWSHIYGHRVCPGDRDRILAYDEVRNAGGAHLKGSTIGLVHFAEDLQALSFELTTNLLNHRNPYTNLTYAEDPALAYVELQNEDDIFFPTTLSSVEQCPTYKKLFCKQFSDWLLARYGSHDALVEAWGKRALDAYPEYQKDEHLDAGNVYPIAHTWHYGVEGLADQERTKGTGRRLLDTARFLYETQCGFYGRFAEAIRDTGYRGGIVGSCWQAGSGVSHYYNLHSDAQVGIVDRHNYFGGSTGHTLVPGPVNNASMLSHPGSGLLGTGLQQVAGRPFALSEWICTMPNEWVAEGPPIIAAYGLGLQGWDASFEFASKGRFGDTIHNPHVYNIDTPTQIGLYPALVRMIYRGDVQQGEVVSVRKVHVPSLLDGTLGFSEKVEQDGDRKDFAGDLPREVLAVGRALVEFTEQAEKTDKPDLSQYVREGVVESTTKQLHWYPGQRGRFTIDTPGTKAVVGFASGIDHELGDWRIRVETDFAAVFVTAMEPGATLTDCRTALVTGVGRARNTGMVFSDDMSEVVDVGEAPILAESIRARIGVSGRRIARVSALDCDGRATQKELPVDGDEFTIDGAAYRTIYYAVELE